MIFILIVSFLLIAYFVLVAIVLAKRSRRKFSKKDLQYVNSNWYRILDSFEHNHKEAVLEADKLLHYCLKKRGGCKFDGLSLGEMLKKSDGFFSNVDGVWFAHKLRNKVAHEMDGKISRDDAKMAISSYKKALIDLGVKL